MELVLALKYKGLISFDQGSWSGSCPQGLAGGFHPFTAGQANSTILEYPHV